MLILEDVESDAEKQEGKSEDKGEKEKGEKKQGVGGENEEAKVEEKSK